MITLPEVDIDFDEEKHLYTLRGYRLPSVTQLMKPMSAMVYSEVSGDVLIHKHFEYVSAVIRYGLSDSGSKKWYLKNRVEGGP